MAVLANPLSGVVALLCGPMLSGVLVSSGVDCHKPVLSFVRGRPLCPHRSMVYRSRTAR